MISPTLSFRYKTKPELWKELSLNNMQDNVSWDLSAKTYLQTYRSM